MWISGAFSPALRHLLNSPTTALGSSVAVSSSPSLIRAAIRHSPSLGKSSSGRVDDRGGVRVVAGRLRRGRRAGCARLRSRPGRGRRPAASSAFACAPGRLRLWLPASISPLVGVAAPGDVEGRLRRRRPGCGPFEDAEREAVLPLVEDHRAAGETTNSEGASAVFEHLGAATGLRCREGALRRRRAALGARPGGGRWSRSSRIRRSHARGDGEQAGESEGEAGRRASAACYSSRLAAVPRRAANAV